MNKIFVFLLTLFLLPVTVQASLATEGVGGGGGVLCKTSTETTLELLDFWDGENLRFIDIQRVAGNPVEQAQKALKRWFKENTSLTISDRLELTEILRNIELQIKYDLDTFIPTGTEFIPPSDALARIVKSGCSLVGIANYYDVSNVIRLDRRYYEMLSDTDKAGLMIHETVYRFMRLHLQVHNSITARGVTACLFSSSSCPEINIEDGILQEGPVFRCQAGESDFVIYSVKNPKFDVTIDMSGHPGYVDWTFLDLWRIQFLKSPQVLVTKVYYQFPALEGDKIMNTQGVIERTYSDSEVAARSSEKFYRNLPYFESHQSVHLKYVMNPATRALINIKGSLGAKDFSCKLIK